MFVWYLVNSVCRSSCWGLTLNNAQVCDTSHSHIFNGTGAFYLWRYLDVANVFPLQRFSNMTSLIDPLVSTDSLSLRLCKGALTVNYLSLSLVQVPKKVNSFDDKATVSSTSLSVHPSCAKKFPSSENGQCFKKLTSWLVHFSGCGIIYWRVANVKYIHQACVGWQLHCSEFRDFCH